MLKNFIMLGLLSLSTIVLCSPEAEAAICITGFCGGSCCFKSNTVECDLNADHVGNLTNNPTLRCDLTPQATTSGPAGLLICGAPGNNNPSPGIQVVQIFSTVAGFGASQTLTKNDKQTGGVYTKNVFTHADLSSLSSFCPNTGWIVLDYVPCTAAITATQSDDVNGVVDFADFVCTLSNCANLPFVSDQTGVHFVRQQYSCTRQ